MLARTFKTAEELKLDDKQYEALKTVLSMMERGDWTIDGTPYRFNMMYWNYDNNKYNNFLDRTEIRGVPGCGTVCCIGGMAEEVSGCQFCKPLDPRNNKELDELFYCISYLSTKLGNSDFSTYQARRQVLMAITMPQAAQALNNFLTTGQAKWEEILC